MNINTIYEERKTEFFIHLMWDFLTYIKMRLLPSLCAVLYFWGGKNEVAATLSSSFASPPSQNWTHAHELARNFVNQLNITEKSNIVTGTYHATTLDGELMNCIGNISPIPRLNFTGICLNDGPAAVARQDLISVFPSGVTLAATWDRDLVYQSYKALGEEFRGKGTHVALGPVAGPLGRHPLGGRNWEGFSPDPYLTGHLMTASIAGMQSVGVQTSSKHFIGNEQETQRTNSQLPDGTNIDAISSNIDDRTLHELYLWPFADAVRAGTTSIMCSYNRINGTYACENPHLLNDILKGELGFQGYVVSDFFATHSGYPAANAGLDMDMPGYVSQAAITTGETYFGPHIISAIQAGNMTEDRLDDMATRIMTSYFLLNQYSDYPTPDPSQTYVEANMFGYDFGAQIPARDVRANHSSLIRQIGSAATVLLKNTNNILPLSKPLNIGVFGNSAPDPTDGLTWPKSDPNTGFDIGTLDIGGGSGSARHTTLTSPLTALRNRVATYGARVQYLTNNAVISTSSFASIYPTPEICLVFLKTFSSEGVDRESYPLDWNSILVVNNVASFCNGNTIVVTHSSGKNTLPFAQNPNVSAILLAHYPGEESGNSITDILFGDVNPSGKLAYTIPLHETDMHIPIVNLSNSEVQAQGANAWQSNFTEGLAIDYRGFERNNVTPLYEFGYGLSYTTFNLTSSPSIQNLTNQSVTARPDPLAPILPGGNADQYTPLFTLTTSVKNTGTRTGATVLQLYISLPEKNTPEGTPKKVLRGFEKVEMEGGEEKEVVFVVQRRDVSFWDTELGDWVVPEGEIGVAVGFSVQDLRARVGVVVR
ncbi:putative beta-glucosidase 2 protein [Botrytis fragariae]|uniref:Probable beta-glucosidase G n=1 Tax=Botrytis fragariae TaxID=1964551 RepID=A0A8H6EIJ1_9HELO|nr:putative beta-glucosidase 2 protein [Botrytis fragariae]KAF5873165.1 putative beta-glucosidase 2 protein [Botrytis fragariae]